MKPKITCIGHSGFLIELPEYNLIFDYYTDKTGVLTPEIFKHKRTLVFVSHGHHDHYNAQIFDWRKWGDIIYVLESSVGGVPQDVDAIRLREGDSLDILNGAVSVRAYGSTDEGVSFLVGACGLAIFHAGDLNDWYWEDESTPEELTADEQSYLQIIRQLAGRHIDIAFLPEDPRLGRNAGRGIQHFKKSSRRGALYLCTAPATTA